MILSRRFLFAGAAATLLCAPAIARAASLMKISVPKPLIVTAAYRIHGVEYVESGGSLTVAQLKMIETVAARRAMRPAILCDGPHYVFHAWRDTRPDLWTQARLEHMRENPDKYNLIMAPTCP